MCNVARAMAAREVASNSPVVASNTVESASNTEPVASNAASNKKQRWDRDAYRVYMREYMRRRRGG